MIDATTIEEFAAALREAVAADVTTVVQVQTDPLAGAPSSESWWDVPVSEVSELDTTQAARAAYEQDKRQQQNYLGSRQKVTP